MVPEAPQPQETKGKWKVGAEGEGAGLPRLEVGGACRGPEECCLSPKSSEDPWGGVDQRSQI